jgi:superoxide dismutase, Fe-Mn family
MQFEVPELPYAHDALEPHIDTRTMEIHHGKHHAAYVSKLNDAVQANGLEGKTIEEICRDSSNIPALRNNGGGHYNHSLFWTIMGPNGGEPEGPLSDALNAAFGSFEEFKTTFSNAGATRFGSGWAWLCLNNGQLEVSSTANQDNPLMPDSGCSGTAILCLDVWEHAYYLHYQNRRPDYISAFFNVINWAEVGRRYEEAT